MENNSNKIENDCQEFLFTNAKDFVEWKDNLKKEIRGGKLMFDVPKYHKWLDENELLTYYMDIGKYLK